MPPRLPGVATRPVPADVDGQGSGGPPGRGIPGALTGGSAWLTRGLGQVAAGGGKRAGLISGDKIYALALT